MKGLLGRQPIIHQSTNPPIQSLRQLMSDTTWIIIWAAVIGALFAFLWRAGHLTRLTTYIQQTREELRKCTWPTWEELKGSTVIVAVSIVLLGGFTVLVDFIFTMLVRFIT